jgi:anaerobic ribonucleoside-triphosphate reductase activating protein
MILDFSLINGLGQPSVDIYLTGCDKPVKCPSCHNQELWEVQEKPSLNEFIEKIEAVYEDASNFFPDLRISFLGGEPLAEYNREYLYEITKYLKGMYPNLEIVLYTWRTLEDINAQELTKYTQFCTYGILGSFEIDKRVENMIPASTNQKIYSFSLKRYLEPIKQKRSKLHAEV